MNFTNRNLKYLFEIFGTKIYLTDTLFSTWIIMGILIFLAIIVRIALRNFKDIPSGFQNIIESLIEVMENFTTGQVGEELIHLAPFFFTIFSFILVSNLSGLFTIRPPTADIAVTGTLAIIVFVLIHFTGIKSNIKKYFKNYFSPNPLLFPINLIGEISKPIALCFRLFGNILGGVIIMKIVYEMLPSLLSLVLPDLLHLYFDVFAGVLQAYIFTVLSMTFIKEKAEI